MGQSIEWELYKKPEPLKIYIDLEIHKYLEKTAVFAYEDVYFYAIFKLLRSRRYKNPVWKNCNCIVISHPRLQWLISSQLW